MSFNKQNPFHFSRPRIAGRRTSYIPANQKWDYLPRNYAGMCVTCLRPVQKIYKKLNKDGIPEVDELTGQYVYQDTKCKPCRIRKGVFVKVVRFPSNLLPWRVLPDNLKRPYFDNVLSGDIPFRCNSCPVKYASVAVFLSLCVHTQHAVKNGLFTCRFCCPEPSRTMIKAIDVAIKAKKEAKKLHTSRDAYIRDTLERAGRTYAFRAGPTAWTFQAPQTYRRLDGFNDRLTFDQVLHEAFINPPPIPTGPETETVAEPEAEELDDYYYDEEPDEEA